MYENFYLKPGFFNRFYILNRTFAGEHHARKAQLFRHKRAFIVVYAHLRTRVQGHSASAEYAKRADVGHDKGVRARFRRRFYIIFQRYKFVFLYTGVKSNIDLYPVKVAKVYMLFNVFYREVFRFRARIE